MYQLFHYIALLTSAVPGGGGTLKPGKSYIFFMSYWSLSISVMISPSSLFISLSATPSELNSD